MIATPYGDLEIGSHAVTDVDGVEWIVTVTEAGCTATLANPPSQARTIWPYEFQQLLTDDQLVAIQTSLHPQIIRMRTKVQTLVSPMPFDSQSELFQGVQLLGTLMPDVFPASEVARILAAAPPE